MGSGKGRWRLLALIWPFGAGCFIIPAMTQQCEMGVEDRQAVWRHVAPFVGWVVVMNLPLADLAVRYALQSAVTVGLLLWVRPWRYYGVPVWRAQPLALLVGVGVFALWVLPEAPLPPAWHPFQEACLRFGVRGSATGSAGPSPYAPAQCGWLLSTVRLVGSAFVIAVAEEYFWRGFLMRWMKGQPFVRVEPATIGPGLLLIASVVFGLEHSRWLAGVAAGVAYGYLYIRTRDLAASLTAHVTTNFLLGLYVLLTGRYGFW